MPDTAPFSWTDKFLVGYGPMDAVHREFVTLVNAMLTCPAADMLENLRAFARHAERHFAEELQMMERSAFPATQCHADEHAAVAKSVGEVLPLVEAGRTDIGLDLAQELARWFPAHADYMDASLAHWLVKKAYGGAPIVLRRRSSEAQQG
jgi:hemerythrin